MVLAKVNQIFATAQSHETSSSIFISLLTYNLVTRILRLDSDRRQPDSILLRFGQQLLFSAVDTVWRLPDRQQDREAASAAVASFVM